MDIFSALGVSTRRKILEMLAQKGALSATDIYDAFQTSHPAVSQHLKVLREVNLVKVEKQGRERMYQLNLEKMYEFERWAHEVTKAWDERLDRLEEILIVEQKLLVK